MDKEIEKREGMAISRIFETKGKSISGVWRQSFFLLLKIGEIWSFPVEEACLCKAVMWISCIEQEKLCF